MQYRAISFHWLSGTTNNKLKKNRAPIELLFQTCCRLQWRKPRNGEFRSFGVPAWELNY